jgi:pilus assembly protein CpaB
MKAARIDVPGIAVIAGGPQAETLAPARQTGTLSLALRSIAGSYNKPEDKTGRRGGINTVRFGITTTTRPK